MREKQQESSSAESSYRPHDPGHDYYAPGIYLITLVVRDRQHQYGIFGRLNDDVRAPAMMLSPVGEAVMEEWSRIPAHEASKGRKVRIHNAVCMPDHFHGVIEVQEHMNKSLGQVIWGFKVACTKRWRAILAASAEPKTALPPSQPSLSAQCQPSMTEPSSLISQPPLSAPASCQPSMTAPSLSAPSSLVSQPPLSVQCQPSMTAPSLSAPSSLVSQPSLAAPMSPVPPDLHRLSARQRREYYAAHPEALSPLWDDNYDDTVCLSDPTTGAYDSRHFAAMMRYVDDNPRRAIICRLRPDYMRRCLHVLITCRDAQGKVTTRDYAAFGNLFLLRWARKVQVFFHRKARIRHLTKDERDRFGYLGTLHPDHVTTVPYERTAAFRDDCRELKRKVMAGATVLVTPGISMGERIIKERCIERGYPLIHLQKEAIGSHWKPESSRFAACSSGSLLILAPWKPDAIGDVNGVPSTTDYSIFHNLNQLASEFSDGEILDLSISHDSL